MMQHIFCFVIFMFVLRFGKPQCFGQREQSCCNGFAWDSKDEICKPCQIGFFGYNCTLRCRYPNYGEQCQGVCTCVKSSCNPIHGCTNNEFSAEFKTSTELQKKTLKIISFTQTVIKQNINPVPNVYVISSITILGAAIIIFPFVILTYKIMKFRFMQFGQRNGNDGNIVTYLKRKSYSLELIHDSPGRPSFENTLDNSHGYEEITLRQFQQPYQESENSAVLGTVTNESLREDEYYLSPI